NTCRARSSGSASMRSLRSFRSQPASGGVRGVREDEIDGLAHAEDPCCLLVGHLHPVGVLQLLDERVEIQRIGLEVLLETGPLVDHRRVDLELVGQVTANQGQDFLAGHGWLGTVDRSSDDAAGWAGPVFRTAPAASRAAWVRPTTSP